MSKIFSSHKILAAAITALIVGLGAAFFTTKGFKHTAGMSQLLGLTTAQDDTIPPKLQVIAMQVKLGQRPNYRDNVTFSDNSGKVKLTIDTSRINLNKAGKYSVLYTATDSAGNETKQAAPLRIIGPDEKIVYLTFDDGPSKNTPEILKILKQNGIHATFFVTAQWPKSFPYIKQAHDEGNAIAAHTYSHRYSIYTSQKVYFNDLQKIEKVIIKYTGRSNKLIRFPGGSSNSAWRKYNRNPKFMRELCKAVVDSGYQYIDWNIDSKDAEGKRITPSAIISNSCREKPRQVCILMHDAAAKGKTVIALPHIIKYYKDRGYVFEVLNSTDFECHHIKI